MARQQEFINEADLRRSLTPTRWLGDKSISRSIKLVLGSVLIASTLIGCSYIPNRDNFEGNVSQIASLQIEHPTPNTTLPPWPTKQLSTLTSTITVMPPTSTEGLTMGTATPTIGAAEFVEWRQTGQAVPELESFDTTMRAYMEARQIHGAALAVTYQGRLVLAKGYTQAASPEAIIHPQSLFRIASLSKPITAVAIFRLIDEGKLDLDDRLVDVLDLEVLNSPPVDQRLNDVTVRHLLQHLGGWDINLLVYDPMFYDFQIASFRQKDLPISKLDIIAYMNSQPLQFHPGDRYSYSNYGYLLLGRIIEKITDDTYESYVIKNVLQPMGIKNMLLGRSFLDESASEEVRYYSVHQGENRILGTNEDISAPYGSFNLENMDSHGGWLGSAVSMARFMVSFDDPLAHPVLSPQSIDLMFAKPNIGMQAGGWYYASGWLVRPVGDLMNTWHTGSLPGTFTLMVRRWDGVNWVVLINQRDDPADPFGDSYQEIDWLLHEAADDVSIWPTHNLFENYQ